MTPVKVTAVLNAPLGSDPPMLDGLCELLMAGKMGTIQRSSNGHRHEYKIAAPGHPIDPEAVGKIPIPIDRKWVGGLPIPRCSSPIMAAALTDDAAHYTKQFPIEQTRLLTGKERTKIVTSGGRFKSFRLPLRTRLVDRVVWFAFCRDRPTRLRQLLKGCRGIGKKTAYGYGAVCEWRVEIIEEDYSWFAESEAGPVLMRPLPTGVDLPDGLLGARMDFGGVCGPYWDQRFYRERIVPC